MAVCLCMLVTSNTQAQTTHVPDTGYLYDHSCNPQSFTTIDNDIIRDNVTGLMWQQATAPGSYNHQEALNYCADLSLGGFDDWRLPSFEELLTLVDADSYNPAIYWGFNTVASYYWSSTTDNMYSNLRMLVDFNGGGSNSYYTDYNYYVRAVRGQTYAPLGDFVINGDGTVTDRDTGLIWQQCNYGQTWNGSQVMGWPAALNWYDARDYI